MSRNLLEFELRAIEDRGMTIKEGRYSCNDIEFVTITPHGGNLVVDKQITPELLTEWKFHSEKEYMYKAYLAWKEGREAPVNGHPIREWPAASPAQVKICEKLGIKAVEELAGIPDDVLPKLGQGARAIRDKAREWIKISGNQGKVLEEIAAVKASLEDIKNENERLRQENISLKEQFEDGGKKGKGK